MILGEFATEGGATIIACLPAAGGVVRGAMSVQVLRAIESIMRRRWNQPAFVLADCVDYAAGGARHEPGR